MYNSNVKSTQNFRSINLSCKIIKEPFIKLSISNKSNVLGDIEYNSLLERDNRHKLKNFNLSKHKEIKLNMRSTLFDWMSEVSSEFNLKSETYQLAVMYTDK